MTAQAQFKRAIGALLKYAKSIGVPYTVTSKKRTKSKQAELVANPQGYPVASPGRSQHEYGLAWDVVFGSGQEYFGQGWTSWGFGWSQSDPVHFAFYTAGDWSQILGQVEISPDYLHGGGPSGFVGGVLQGGYQGMPAAALTRPGSTAGAFSRPAPALSPIVGVAQPSILSRGIAAVDVSPGVISPPVVSTQGRAISPGPSIGSMPVSISPGGRAGGPGGALSTVSTLPGIPSIASRGIAV